MIEEKTFIPLYYDKAFKVVFNNAKREILKLLNELTDIEISLNAKLIIGKEIVPKHNEGKLFRHDAIIICDDNKFVCVEMNNSRYGYSLDRNIIYMFNYLSDNLKEGIKTPSIKEHQARLINLNNFANYTKQLYEEINATYKGCNEIATKLFKIHNIDIVKAYEIMYNEDVRKSRMARVGSIFKATSLEEISNLLGEEMLTMEEKQNLLNAVETANDRYKVDWIEDLNQRLYEQGVIEYCTDEGREEGIKEGVNEGKLSMIKNMLKKKFDYAIISEVSGKSVKEIKLIEANM